VGVASVEAADRYALAVVEDPGVDALRPLAALVDPRIAQPHECAQLEDVLGRDRGLPQPLPDRQLARWRASRRSV
jgi:hypothetical protein